MTTDTNRFVLHEDAARAWLAGEAVGDEGHAGSVWADREDLDEWSPLEYEETIYTLVEAAQQHPEVLSGPKGHQIYFLIVIEDRADYNWTVMLPRTAGRLDRVTSEWAELRKIGWNLFADTKGIDAAMDVLTEAVQTANLLLDRLERERGAADVTLREVREAWNMRKAGDLTVEQFFTVVGIVTGAIERTAEATAFGELVNKVAAGEAPVADLIAVVDSDGHDRQALYAIAQGDVTTGTQPLDLDDDVHDVASRTGSNINNGGTDTQVDFLVTNLGHEATKALLAERAQQQR